MHNYIDKNELLSSLTREDIIALCASLGCFNYKVDSGGNLCFSTSLCHENGDSPYKLVYYFPKSEDIEDESKRNYGTFHCYTCKDTYDAVELVIRTRRLRNISCTFFQALNYIATITNKTNYIISADDVQKPKELISDWSIINRFKQHNKKKEEDELVPYNEHVLELYSSLPHELWLEEGIPALVMSEFEIGYCATNNSITIPHRDIRGRLVGVRCRHLSPYDIENFGKYVPVIVQGEFLKHPLGKNLYGIYQNHEQISKVKKVIIYEAEKSVLKNRGYFGFADYSLATCGANITMDHIALLNQLHVSEVIVAYDKEYEDPNSCVAELYLNKLYKEIAPLLNYFKVTLLLDTKGYLDFKNAPCDKGKEVLLNLLDEKIEITKEDIINHVNKLKESES